MFVFDDLVLVPDREMQKILGEVDKADRPWLKTAPREVSDKRSATLQACPRCHHRGDRDARSKPLSEVEEAQRIVELVRGMEERGEITINRAAARRWSMAIVRSRTTSGVPLTPTRC